MGVLGVGRSGRAELQRAADCRDWRYGGPITRMGNPGFVPFMKMDVSVMDGGPKHPPGISVAREGYSRQSVNPENGKNFGNIPKGEQRTGSHIYHREKP